MSILLAVAALLLSSAADAGLACRLTDADYRALASSPSRLDTAGVQGLDPAKQKLLCRTRLFAQAVDAGGGTVVKAERFSPQYLTSEEKVRANRAVDAVIQSQLAGSGVAIRVQPD